MYLPRHFQASEREAAELLEGIRAADLITPTRAGPRATFLPLIYDGAAGERGALLGYIGRDEDHWRAEAAGDSMVIAHGPEGYVSPGWYESKREHGRVVPTWNYLIAHVYGELRIHEDRGWLEQLIRGLGERQRALPPQPRPGAHSRQDALEHPELAQIVGVELRITRVEAKAKLGQNRSGADIDGVIHGLRSSGHQQLAGATQRGRRDQDRDPHS